MSHNGSPQSYLGDVGLACVPLRRDIEILLDSSFKSLGLGYPEAMTHDSTQAASYLGDGNSQIERLLAMTMS